MMLCNYCGKQFEDGGAFCPYCGTPVENAAAPQQTVPQQTAPQQAAPQYGTPQQSASRPAVEGNPAPNVKPNQRLLSLMILCGLLCLFSGIGMFIYRNAAAPNDYFYEHMVDAFRFYGSCHVALIVSSLGFAFALANAKISDPTKQKSLLLKLSTGASVIMMIFAYLINGCLIDLPKYTRSSLLRDPYGGFWRFRYDMLPVISAVILVLGGLVMIVLSIKMRARSNVQTRQ